jgi:hypothetical protein
MANYKFQYQPKNSDKLTGYFQNLDDDETAAWHAKNYCDHYGHTLIDVKPIKDK